MSTYIITTKIKDSSIISFADTTNEDEIDVQVAYDKKENHINMFVENESSILILPIKDEAGNFSSKILINGVEYDIDEEMNNIADNKEECLAIFSIVVSWKLIVGVVGVLVGVLGYAISQIDFLEIKYAVQELTYTIASTINRYSYYLALVGKDDKLYVSTKAVSQKIAVAYMKAATKKVRNSIYHFNSSYAKDVAYLALPAPPQYHYAHKVGYFSHYHVSNHKSYAHAFYGLPRLS